METLVLAPNEKRCSKCKEVKDRSEFGKDKFRPDGLTCACKGCRQNRSINHVLQDEKRCKQCGNTKARIDFNLNQASKDGLDRLCRGCTKLKQRKVATDKRIEQHSELITCPICNGKFINLSVHLRHTHNMNKEAIAELKIENLMTSQLRRSYSISGRAPKIKSRSGEVVTITKKSITFPRNYWPIDCKYAKVEVQRHNKLVILKPFLKKPKFGKSVIIPPEGPCGHRLRINFHHSILESLDVERDIELNGRRGFAIKFTDRDDPLINLIELWVLDGRTLKNKSAVSVYHYKFTPKISLIGNIWPVNAEYCSLEWYQNARNKKENYIDILPVSRNEHIVDPKTFESKQYIGLDNCLKVKKVSQRFFIEAKGFIRKNNIPDSDWDFKEVLPSGALRFRLYKERLPKEQLEEIAS